ncbi:mucin-5AC [Anoplophora glabripennis]|nr:mucin-5AC [Anoplophora glabripennis]
MFNATNINNSPRSNNKDLYTNINETANGISRSFLQPKITSTPLVKRESIFATPPKHNVLSPRRYSLSEIATPPRQNRRDLTRVVTTGPLLASTKYNVNVSTYEDTKSPGLAGRIVQYNEETEREREHSRPPTHQAKYGSPGLFPVVHLFKKKLPTLDQRPKRVTIRIASPEYSRHHSQEYNRKLLEGIVKPSSATFRASPFSPSHQSSSTRSVLDALKEISRKRIHANEEYDLNEDSGKRLRTMNNGDSNKRLRDDSPLDKSPSPSKPTSKRVCMYDEYAASCSSTDFSFKKAESLEPKRKSISISTLTDNPKESKQVKLINVETQTATTETVENTEQTKPPAEDQGKTEVSDESVGKKKSPLKIFDDAPLERIRKNRLAALMGSLTGKEPVLLPKPDYATVLNSQAENPDVPDSAPPEVLKSTEKSLVSILASPKKSSPTKSSKHVHFSVPESTSETNLSSTSVLSFPATSVAIPETSASETKLTFGSSSKTSRETPAPPSSPVGLQLTSGDTENALPVITFGSGSNSSSATSIVSKESSTSSIVAEAPKTGFSIPNFQFKPPTTAPPVLSTTSNSTPAAQLIFSSTTLTGNAPSTTSPPKKGGFKFDLSKPVSTSATATISSAPTFSFGSNPQPTASKSSSNFASAVVPSSNTQNTKPEAFSFGAKAVVPTTATSSALGLSFGTTTTSSSLGAVVTTSATPTFTFGAASSENKTVVSAGFPLTHSNTFGVASTTTSVPAFGTNTSTPAAASVPAFGPSKAPFFSFGASKPTSVPSGFGVPATTTSAVTFGAPSSTSNSFGTPTSNFLNTSAPLPPPSFGTVTTSSTLSGSFGAPTPSNAGFGSNATPMFNVNKTVSPFAVTTSAPPAFGTASTTNAPLFGKNNAPQFGQATTQATFGAPTTTVSFVSANAFGATTTTTSSSVFGGANSSSVFGSKSGGFGPPSNNANIFGGPVNTQPSNFGTSVSKPMFGTVTTSPFATSTNTTATPSFGSSNTPAFNFGAKTTASSFGSSNSFGTTTTASTGFGNAAPPAFGASNSFGGPTNFGTGNAFGASGTPAFGVVTTSTQPSSFGVTTTPSFGTASTGFNAVDKNSVFNASSAPPAFGNNAVSPFNPSTTTPGFGNTGNTPGFGASTGVSAFAKPQATPNPFGAPASNAFGTSNSFGAAQPQASSFGPTNPPNTQNAVFSFGATSPPKPPGVFSFGAGAPGEVPKPTFNFTGGNTAVPAFGSGGAPSFGSSGPAPFGAPSVPQFGAAQAGAQGMFSIGSGSSSGKARTHLKPKRRT